MSAGPDRAIAFMQHFGRYGAYQKTMEGAKAACCHHDEIDVLV